jgi:ABC-type Fe3+-citrate transport system substrate-binding protein
MKKKESHFNVITDADEKERNRKIAEKQKKLAEIRRKIEKCKSSDLTLPIEDIKFLLAEIDELNNVLKKIFV